jgi:magnesium chelatase subunit I
MKLGLILNVINPTLSGVLIRGEKGTAKSTAVRSLAEILPQIVVVKDCPFQLAPAEYINLCRECGRGECREQVLHGEPATVRREIRVIELPVGATEDRVVGTLDLEHALKKGEKRFEPGILAAAHRGILYVDEVNLLDDHVVDVLLDSAAMGVCTVEREGVSFSHPARFTLVGTMNPEEGELRPQLLDRFGFCVNIEGIHEVNDRVAIMERRAAFEENPENFRMNWDMESKQLVEKIVNAMDRYPQVMLPRELLFEIASYCLDVGVDGHRGDIIILKTAKTLAAYQERTEVNRDDIDQAAELALPHRIRRQPLQEIASNVKEVRHSRK